MAAFEINTDVLDTQQMPLIFGAECFGQAFLKLSMSPSTRLGPAWLILVLIVRKRDLYRWNPARVAEDIDWKTIAESATLRSKRRSVTSIFNIMRVICTFLTFSTSYIVYSFNEFLPRR